MYSNNSRDALASLQRKELVQRREPGESGETVRQECRRGAGENGVNNVTIGPDQSPDEMRGDRANVQIRPGSERRGARPCARSTHRGPKKMVSASHRTKTTNVGRPRGLFHQSDRDLEASVRDNTLTEMMAISQCCCHQPRNGGVECPESLRRACFEHGSPAFRTG